ncbi:MAG: endonuclease/exonuclease/phosphatase family protein [Myxococcota bacterium]
MHPSQLPPSASSTQNVRSHNPGSDRGELQSKARNRLASTIAQARTIQDLQGTGSESPFVGQQMASAIRGVVTGHISVKLGRRHVKAFTVQMPDAEARDANASKAIVVVPPKGSRVPELASEVTFKGQVLELQQLGDSPVEATTTAVRANAVSVKKPGATSPEEAFAMIMHRGVKPLFWNVEESAQIIKARLEQKGLKPTAQNFRREQAEYLSSIESSLIAFKPGSTLASPSNPFGDYVVIGADHKGPKTANGAPRQTAETFQQAVANIGFSVGAVARSAALRSGGEGQKAYATGSALMAGVWGALGYRAGAPQVQLQNPKDLVIESKEIPIQPLDITVDPKTHLVVLCLNTFNFDPHVEDPDKVQDPKKDISDDIGAGRHLSLVDVTERGGTRPGLIVTQEMQVNDGAELSDNLNADETYAALIEPLNERSGKNYQATYRAESWKTAGGQPGGNIHLGFIWDPDVVKIVGEPIAIGADSAVFAGSRKPLATAVRHRETGETTVVVNVHQTSLRHSRSPVAKLSPGEDPRSPVRVEQNLAIIEFVKEIEAAGVSYMVTGDFNDSEFSESMRAYEERGSKLAHPNNGDKQADYNHRGTAQNLSHVVVSSKDLDRIDTATSFDEQDRGVPMGELESARSSDHGALWATIKMNRSATGHDDHAVATLLQRAAQKANAFTNDIAERAGTDPRLLCSLSFSLSKEDWVGLSEKPVLEKLDDYVQRLGMMKDSARDLLLERLAKHHAPALRRAAMKTGNTMIVRLIKTAIDGKEMK